MGWGMCVPDGDDRRSRAEKLYANDVDLDLPDCDAVYIVEYLFQIGPQTNGGAVPHSEIESWQRNTGVELSSWECSQIRKLSCEFLHEASQTSELREAPYTTEMKIKRDREIISKRIKSLLGSG